MKYFTSLACLTLIVALAARAWVPNSASAQVVTSYYAPQAPVVVNYPPPVSTVSYYQPARLR